MDVSVTVTVVVIEVMVSVKVVFEAPVNVDMVELEAVPLTSPDIVEDTSVVDVPLVLASVTVGIEVRLAGSVKDPRSDSDSTVSVETGAMVVSSTVDVPSLTLRTT